MDPLPPSHVREIGSTRPRLRNNLKYSFHEYNGERSCIIEDPLTSKFHRIGLAEYRFLTHLNGKVTFSEAFARSSLSSGAQALSERQAIAVLSWLVENRLADLGGNVPDEIREEARGKQISSSLRNIFNVLFIRVPLGRPDGLLNKLYPIVKWVCGWLFLPVWLAVVGSGIVQVGIHWERLVRGTEGILAPGNWLWLALVWILLKLWHETWHGIVCKHHGGEIREAGVLLVLFTPLGYVDASSSWSFPSKWKRIHVAAAGMYGEFFMAAIAALVWSQTSPGLWNTLALNTMVMASTITLLFNINPLMRFDGYFILSDLLELPNLYTRSSQLIRKLSKRWILGVKTLSPTNWKLRESWIYLTYGIASLFWRIFIITTLLIAASLLFRGGGLLFAVIGFVFWVGPMTIAFCRYLWFGNDHEKPNRLHAISRCLLIGCGLFLITLIPIGMTIRSPALVQFSEQVILRTECPGFITGIHVRDGMSVEKGQLLVTLSNEAVESQLEKMAIRYERQSLKTKLTHVVRQFAEYEAEGDALEALRVQYQEQAKYVETLDVVAPKTGKVIAPWLPAMRGRFLNTGDEILRVAQPYAGEIVVPVSQNDIDYFRRHVGKPVTVRINGRLRVQKGILRSLNARATTQIEHPSLTTLGGGPLSVRVSDTGHQNNQSSGHELVTPVFWAYVDLQQNSPHAQPLYSGERARIKFHSDESRTLGYLIYAKITHFFDWVFARASLTTRSS